MKTIRNLFTTTALLLIVLFINAQAPQGFNYQAVVRDGSGNLVTSGSVKLQFTINESTAAGSSVYSETHNVTPNAYGLVTATIGGGSVESGSFSNINWASDKYYLKVEADPAGGTNYADLGTTQLMSVPYALNAKTADALTGGSSSPWTVSGNNIYSSNSGNVGIGVTAPTRKLEVAGNSILIGDVVAGRAGNSLVFGIDAMQGGNTGSAFGNGALKANTTGYDNSAFGTNALIKNRTGFAVTAFGVRALESNISGDGLTAIGHLADVTDSNFNNSTVIGNFTAVDASNKVRIGNGAVSSIGGQVAWTNFSDQRIKNNIQDNVVGLEFIKALRPVTYHFDVKKQEELIGIKEVMDWEGKYDIESIQFSGFLAQDVEMAAQKAGYDFSGIDKSGKIMGVRYSEFVVPIVKAMQEQQQMIEDLREEIELLKSTR